MSLPQFVLGTVACPRAGPCRYTGRKYPTCASAQSAVLPGRSSTLERYAMQSRKVWWYQGIVFHPITAETYLCGLWFRSCQLRTITHHITLGACRFSSIVIVIVIVISNCHVPSPPIEAACVDSSRALTNFMTAFFPPFAGPEPSSLFM